MKRVLLRAELRPGDEAVIVGHTLEVSETEVFVETTAELPVGSEVELQLSFPRLVQAIALIGKVKAICRSTAPGEPAGLELTIAPQSAADADRLSMLVAFADDAHSDEQLQRFRVLLVEDNNLIRDMFSFGLKKYFRNKGGGAVTVDFAVDGDSAWSMLRDGAYDLAIVDYYLPAMNGAQLVQRMRAEPRLASVPVVAVSVGGSEARDATLAAGADLFLDKPLVLKDLFATLERLYASGAAR